MKLFDTLSTTFDNFDNTVRNYLSKTFNNLGLNYSSSQIFGVIFDGMKGIMQNIMFYIEDGLTEQNIYTATRKKSFYNLAKLSGYDPYYGSAATGIININAKVTNIANKPTASKIFLRNHSRLVNDTTGVSYILMMPVNDYVVDLSKPLMKHQLKIVQGVWNSVKMVGTGKNFESFNINAVSLFDKQYMKVYVNGEEFTQAASLYDMINNSKEYIVSCGFDSTIEITFGNGVHGYSIKNGDSIVVEYLTHDGSLGNIITLGSESFTIKSPVYNVAGDTIAADEYLRLSIDAPISGGTEADSVELVRKMVGYNSRSLVLASEDNFKQFLKRFSFVGRTNIYTQPSTLTVTAGCLTNIMDKVNTADEYFNIEVNDLLLTDDQKTMIKTALSNSNKVFTGINFEFIDPVIRKYAATCYVKVEEQYMQDIAKANITNAIADYFINLPENTKFIPKSDIIKICLEADENIKSFDLDFISQLNEDAYYNGYYNKYQQKLINGIYKYVPIKTMYDKTNVPGLDAYGNIKLDSELEMPLLHGGFNYYPEKLSKNKNDMIRVEALQIIFI